VYTMGLDTFGSTDEIVWHAVERAAQRGLIASGDMLVVLAGSPKKSVDTAADVLRIVQVD
jgi:pyruvate kinase